MADDRARRAAITEAAFRIANDRMAAWVESSATEPELFFCECMNAGCREKLPLTRDEYEVVRAHANRFFVVPGHENDELETVIDRRDAYFIIEKPPELGPITRATNPRTAPDGGPEADEARRLADEIGED
jgi:hypothetical protein